MTERSCPIAGILVLWLTGAAAATCQEPVVSLVPQPDLAPGFAGMPRLAGTAPAAARINADLAGIDARALLGSADCRASAKSDWARWITRRFSGPEFLGLSESNDFYCDGAAHPDQFQRHHTWDLATGAAVDWATLLPASLDLVPAYATGWRRSDADPYASDALARLYTTHLPADHPADCAGFAQPPTLSFTFALSAAGHALALIPSGYAYIDRPCAVEVLIPVEVLRGLGAAQRLTGALEQSADRTGTRQER